MTADSKVMTRKTTESNDSCCSNSSCCPPPSPVARTAPKIGRNDPCACGSGRKFKKCCG